MAVDTFGRRVRLAPVNHAANPVAPRCMPISFRCFVRWLRRPVISEFRHLALDFRWVHSFGYSKLDIRLPAIRETTWAVHGALVRCLGYRCSFHSNSNRRVYPVRGLRHVYATQGDNSKPL